MTANRLSEAISTPNAAPAGSVTIVPNDTTAQGTFKGLYVGVSGDVKVRMLDNSTPTFKAMPVGMYQMQFDIVFSTGTAATNMVGLQ